MNRSYLIPANMKRSGLIFGLFRSIDLIIFGVGIGITLLLMLIVGMETTTQLVIVLAPAMICAFLVLPVPYYHNMLNVLVEAYEFITTNQKLIWRGWCFKYGEETNKKQ